MAGNKNSGRRGFGEETKRLKERIKQQTIEELATDVVHGHLKTIDKKKDRQGVKEIAMPVYLKSKADKVDVKANLNINFDDTFNITREAKENNNELS